MGGGDFHSHAFQNFEDVVQSAQLDLRFIQQAPTFNLKLKRLYTFCGKSLLSIQPFTVQGPNCTCMCPPLCVHIQLQRANTQTPGNCLLHACTRSCLKLTYSSVLIVGYYPTVQFIILCLFCVYPTNPSLLCNDHVR